MNTDGGTKDDVKLPDSKLGEEILAGFEVADTVMVTVTAAMGEEQVRSSCSALAVLRFLMHVPGYIFQGLQSVNVCFCFGHILCSRFSHSLGLSLLIVAHVLSFFCHVSYSYFQSISAHVLSSRHCTECTSV